MMMPNRKFAANNSYRYGFNGKENDNEVKGEGNQQDYGMRVYDPRLGKFLSVDPLQGDFPWNSAYSYAEGDPINFNDIDGLEKGEIASAARPTRTIPKINVLYEETLLNGISGGSLPVSRNNPGNLPPNAGATRYPAGWLVATPNGGYFQPDYNPHRKSPEQVSRDQASYNATLVRKSIESRAYNDQATVIPDLASHYQRHTDDINNLTEQDKEYLNERNEKGTTTAQDKVHLAQQNRSGKKHHIATNKNIISSVRGGPWTPRFKSFFDNAGLDINKGSENLVDVINHKGPHPQEYHNLVFKRLSDAVVGLKPKTVEYKTAVTNTLQTIGKEAQTSGSTVNKLLTKQ